MDLEDHTEKRPSVTIQSIPLPQLGRGYLLLNVPLEKNGILNRMLVIGLELG